MKNKIIIPILFLGVLMLSAIEVAATKVIHLRPQTGDMTAYVRAQLENADQKEIELIFAPGTYQFRPDLAFGKYCAITNHDNGWKKIIFPFKGYDKVIINGNGAELIFHGQVMPFQFEQCASVLMKGVTIDWDIPFTIQGEVLASNEEEKWIDLRMFTEGYAWELIKGKLTFPNIDGFKFTSLGSSLPFDAKHKRVAHGAWDMSSSPNWVEQRDNNVLRIHEHRKQYPRIGEIAHYKGPKGENRYAPAIHVISSQNIHLEDVIVHHALGMGFLMERSENATLLNCGVYVREGSDRVVSIIADATHFCNCKGDILVENCRFENMLDDGTNVHGTYTVIKEIVDDNTLIVELAHFQQAGFEFAGKNDEIWFIHQPNPQRGKVKTVKSVKVINERFIQIEFESKLPTHTVIGDLLENKTWNPNFTMRGCTIKNHRARNIILKTPKKVVIENNDLSSMMSSILFRGESFYWYESGALQDVLINNNRFNYFAYSGAEHALLYITPRLGKTFDSTISYDRNIRFTNNTITNFDNRIIWADRVDGMLIKGNKIQHIPNQESLYPEAPLFEFSFSKNVEILQNEYMGNHKNILKADQSSMPHISMRDNKGFNNTNSSK